MNIGMVSTFVAKCGIATYTKYLCEALEKNEVYTHVLGEFPYPESALDPEFNTKIPYNLCWRRDEYYNEVVEWSKNYDILHIQHQFGLFPVYQATAKLYQEAKKPIVTTLHDVVPPNSQMRLYFDAILNGSAKVIVHTKTCEDILKQWDIATDKISMIPHGTLLVDIPDKAKMRAELKVSQDAEVIMSWGFIWESKGIIDLIRILAEVLKTHPKAMLIHAGGVHPIIQGSEYLRMLIKEATKLGITPKNFMITQWVPEANVPKWFAVADVIVLNYMRGSASASGAAHRALASHRPIVKTDDPCLEEIPGYTVGRFCTTDLYQAIIKVLETPALQQKLVEKQDLAAIAMSWDNIAKQHKALYESL